MKQIKKQDQSIETAIKHSLCDMPRNDFKAPVLRSSDKRYGRRIQKKLSN